MKFKIQQIALAINPERRADAMELLRVLGIDEWVHDTVEAEGKVHQMKAANTANLSFNYTALEEAKELELLTYVKGRNWLTTDTTIMRTQASHIGMHCTEEELLLWRNVLCPRLAIAQEVYTQSHSNPEIAGKRWYHYLIFAARAIIGVDIKFIVRHFEPGEL